MPRRWWILLLALSHAPAWAQPPPRERLPDVVLSNGLRVMGCEDRSTSLTGVHLAVKLGAEAEAEALPGARYLLQELFRYRLEEELRGQRQFLDLSNALLVGRGLDLSTDWDHVSLVTLCPRSELRALLEVIAQVCFVEPLSETALGAAHLRAQEQWRRSQANPAEATYYLFRRALLGDTPAARPVFPSPQTLPRLTLPALQALRDRYYVPGNSLLTLAGPDEPNQLVAEAVEAMTAIPRRPAPGGWLPDYPPQPSNVQVGQNPHLRSGRLGIASLIIGFRFPALTDPDFPAALVLYQRLAGDGGVLATDARFRQTLNSALAGYTVRGPLLVDAMPPAAEAVPYTAIHVQSAPDAIVQVQEALLRVLYEVRDTPSGEQALSRARRRAINALALAGLDQPGRARTLGEWALFARGWAPLQRLPESISRVTQADLTRVATRCFSQQYIGLQMP